MMLGRFVLFSLSILRFIIVDMSCAWRRRRDTIMYWIVCFYCPSFTNYSDIRLIEFLIYFTMYCVILWKLLFILILYIYCTSFNQLKTTQELKNYIFKIFSQAKTKYFPACNIIHYSLPLLAGVFEHWIVSEFCLFDFGVSF